jgi:signal transduction histidine kinase
MHEINNPLATIGACAESLEIGLNERTHDPVRDGAVFKDSLTLIQNEVHRCKGIIDGLLDFSRPKTTTKSLVDLNVSIEKTINLVKHHPRFKRVIVGVELGGALRPVLANEEQMVQVFMALILNALDAINEEGVITLRTRPDPDNQLSIAEVIDGGHGIRSADRTKIFEPFFTTKLRAAGRALSSICYAIVTEHGGRIEVDSVVGEGSVFRSSCPRAPHERANCRQSNSNPRRRGRGKPGRFFDVLRGRGHYVVCVGDGKAALQAVRDEAFDVALRTS